MEGLEALFAQGLAHPGLVGVETQRMLPDRAACQKTTGPGTQSSFQHLHKLLGIQATRKQQPGRGKSAVFAHVGFQVFERVAPAAKLLYQIGGAGEGQLVQVNVEAGVGEGRGDLQRHLAQLGVVGMGIFAGEG